MPLISGNVQQAPVEAAAPAGPPQFSLSDDESIQKFRDSLSSRFAPESARPSNRDSVRGSVGYDKNIQKPHSKIQFLKKNFYIYKISEWSRFSFYINYFCVIGEIDSPYCQQDGEILLLIPNRQMIPNLNSELFPQYLIPQLILETGNN